jgi:hypothetical protein
LLTTSTEADLEYFIREAGSVLGVVPPGGGANAPSAKHVLEIMLRQIVRFKKVNYQMDDDS